MPIETPVLALNATGDQVKTVQTNLAKVGFTIPPTETAASTLGPGTALAVKTFQIANKLPVTGTVTPATQTALNNAAATAGTNQSTVSGVLTMDNGLPANVITARLYSIGYGGAATKLVEAKTDANGVYSLAYPPPASSVNVEVRVADAQGNETTVSSVIYNAPPQLVLNLVVPSSVQPLTAEYDRLAADVQGAIGGTGIQNLATAKETSTQQDLTLLNQSTGWDARMLALAATAAQNATPTGLESDVLYGLFRTGLPTDPQTLALIPPASIATALTKASQAGIVNLNAAAVTAAQTSFTTFAVKTNLAKKVSGAPSSFSDLLTNVVTDSGQQAAFAGVFFDPTVSDANLWTKAAAAGISAANIATMKLQGKLAFLTANNASLVQKLQTTLGAATDPAVLADMDFHLPATWVNTINAITGNDATKLPALIPAAYGGATATDQLTAYAADLARKVRVSYPTRVVARMAESGSFTMPPSTTPPASVISTTVAFWRTADSAGYQLGRTPLNAFLKNLPKSIPAPDAPTIALAKTLHRLYQITPSNESLQAALKAGFTSARDVVKYTSDEFGRRFGSFFPSALEANLVYQKAQQVASVTLNLFATAKQLDIQPAIFAMTASAEQRQNARNAIGQQFPSMAGLFGSLDFCECDDCSSVLSPAAYFVDILHFLDPDPTDWQSTITNWQNDHNGQAYPFTVQGAAGTPFQALTSRRPDLPNLNLSCENTNTALPYIDAVNEILEYFVANNGVLAPTAVYDTGSANSADLVAEPQNVLPAAYSVLANRVAATPALYPVGLPFDLWIETVRGFLNYFKIPLGKILETFRPTDPLELFGNPTSYSHSAIFVESLGLSPAEYHLYTQSASLSNWFQLYGYTNAASAAAALSSAETLADSLDITYQDLTDIIQTGFLNPGLVPLTIPLRKFGLSLNDVFTYTSQTGFLLNPPITAAQKTTFETKLQGLMGQYYPPYAAAYFQNWLNSILTAGYSNKVLVLQAPAQNPGNFQATTFQYAGGAAAANLDYLKLNLFVRLWKKLGWSIDELNRALQVFLVPLIPAATDANFATDFSNAMATALIYLSHLQSLFGRLPANGFGRTSLLPIWTGIDIPTNGVNPLYAQMFLTAAVLNNDPIFDDPTGQYLSYFDSTQNKYLPFRWQAAQTGDNLANGYVLLGNHLTAVQGAFGLAANDVQAILVDQGADISSAPLTQDNLSLIYRYALLANGLGLSIPDFIAVRNMAVDKISQTPLNPIAGLKSGPLAVLADDVLWSQTIQFVEAAGAVQKSGFAVQDLQYILRHQIADPAGKYNPDPALLLQQIRSLAAILSSIQAETAVPADPTSFTDDLIRQKMSLVYSSDVVQAFMGMWNGTIQYSATPVSVTGPMPAAVFAQDGEIKLAYDSTTNLLSLTFQGVPAASMLTALGTELTNLVTATTITAAQQTLLQGMLNDVRGQALTFFQTNLQASPTPGPQNGFLQPVDFDNLFPTLFPTPPTTAATLAAAQVNARKTLAQEFLPFLQAQLMDQAICQALVAQLGSDASLTQTLLTSATILSDPTQTASTALVEAFKAAEDQGVTGTYFSDAAEQTSIGSASLPTVNTDAVTNPNKPAGVNSAHFEGYLEVPVDGPYRFTAILPNSTATVALQFDFMTAPLTLSAGTATGTPATYPYSNFTQFKAGIPCHFTVDFQGLGGGDARLLVQGETIPQGPLSQLTLYPEASVQRYNRAQILLAKTLQLIQGFELDENEVTYIIAHAGDFGNVSFNALPTQASDDSPAKAQALFGQFLRLAGYAALRAGPAGGTDGLISVFQNARQTIPNSPLPTPLPIGVTNALQLASYNFYQAIANLTRRDVPTTQAVILQLWGAGAIQTSSTGGQTQFTVAALVNDLGFARLWEALQMVQTLGVQPQVLGQITGIVYPSRASAATDSGSTLASALRNALKSRYTPDQWRPVAQSVFDPLRQKKRDALCAYILTLSAIVKFGATDTNGLFEYFLVDPGMEPVVQTSRIRLALSSVQTFIQRCLLNLEPQVKPSVLNADNWAWMKRYRVWEANREIFLWPENWLIPEFRENATDLFQALQGTLLQGDITQDLVEQAYTQYLQDLDTRAQLDIVSMFNQPPAAGDAATANTLHVIGRNHGKPRKYFYRTYANGIWNGWIPVTPDIEGDHVVAVIWRGRLTIFWLTFAVQSGPANTATASQSNSDGTSSSSNVTSLSFGDFSNLVTAGKPPTTMQIQLNWSEYYQNKWTTRSSSDLNQFTPVQVKDGFAPSADVLARASIDTDSNGNETAVRLHLDYSDGGGWAFRLTGKNSEPAFSAANWEPLQDTGYYDTSAWDATKYVGYSPDPTTNPESGSALFQVEFTQQMSLAGGEVQSSSSTTASILQNVNSFNLLLCDNLPLAAVNGPANSPYQNFTNQITFLSSPLFYEDTTDPNTSNELCFFVQPAVTETSVSRWVGWAIRPTFPDLTINNPNYWNVVNLTAQVPIRYLPVQPDPAALVSYRPNLDVFANDATRVSYGTAVIGRAGATTASANVAGALRGAGAKIISSAGLGIGGALSIAAKPQTKDFAATTKSHFIQ